MNTDLENSFLTELVEKEVSVHVFLVSGIKLIGKIGKFDDRCVLLHNSISQVIYKSAISTIVPKSEVDLH